MQQLSASHSHLFLPFVPQGTVALMFTEIGSIDRLTATGAAQLAADLSHWSKVSTQSAHVATASTGSIREVSDH